MLARFVRSSLETLGPVAFTLILAGCGTPRSSTLDGVSPEASCPWQAPSDLLFDALKDATPPAGPLTVDQMRTDLACLKAILQKEYVAAEIYSSQGIDLGARADQLAAALTAPLTVDDFVAQLLTLHKGVYDVHLSYQTVKDGKFSAARLPLYSIYATTWSFSPGGNAYTTKDPATGEDVTITACDGFQPSPTVDASGATGSMIFAGQTNEATPTVAHCALAGGGSRDVAVAPVALDKLPGDAGTFHYEQTADGILYVRIPLMPEGIQPDQQKLLDLLAEASTTAPIIFDLRQNRGGDSTFGNALATTLRATNDQLPGFTLEDMQSIYASASVPNADLFIAEELEQTGDTVDAATLRKAYQVDLAALNQAVASGLNFSSFNVAKNVGPVQTGTRSSPYPSPIILLTDKHCASSCEFMLAMFNGAPNAYRVGANSLGALHFGNVGTLLLPNSKVIFYGGWRGFAWDKEVPEGLGFTPDYYVTDGDTLGAATALIKLREVPGS
jgi:hypothetical protein